MTYRLQATIIVRLIQRLAYIDIQACTFAKHKHAFRFHLMANRYLNSSLLRMFWNKFAYSLPSALRLGPSHSIMAVQPIAARGLQQVRGGGWFVMMLDAYRSGQVWSKRVRVAATRSVGLLHAPGISHIIMALRDVVH